MELNIVQSKHLMVHHIKYYCFGSFINQLTGLLKYVYAGCWLQDLPHRRAAHNEH